MCIINAVASDKIRIQRHPGGGYATIDAKIILQWFDASVLGRLVCTTEGATQTDPVDEQDDDGRVVADKPNDSVDDLPLQESIDYRSPRYGYVDKSPGGW